MAELSRTNHAEIHEYSGSRDMTAGRRVKIILTGGDEEDETILNEKTPKDESWVVKFSVVKIIDND